MAATDTVFGRPTVSGIVPARNEEACLDPCLRSLVAQTGVTFEIIVVDDHSTDRTRQIASSVSSPSLPGVEAGPLPRVGRQTRGDRRKLARRCGHGPRRQTIRQKDFLPLRRRRCLHPHVPQLRPTLRRLDQEPGTLVPLTHAPGRIARARICADRRKPGHRHRERGARAQPACLRDRDTLRDLVCHVPCANPPRPLFLALIQPPALLPPVILLSPVSLEYGTRTLQY